MLNEYFQIKSFQNLFKKKRARRNLIFDFGNVNLAGKLGAQYNGFSNLVMIEV